MNVLQVITEALIADFKQNKIENEIFALFNMAYFKCGSYERQDDL